MVSVRVTVTLPSTKFAGKGWATEIARTQRQTSVPRLRRLFQQTVFGWSNKPSFGWAQQRSADQMSITMYPQGAGTDIWILVNAGAKPHTILPTSRSFLIFRPGYRASTTPGTLQSRRAYRSGRYIRARKVNHPGFEAREFTKTIAEEYHNPFMNEMQDALNRVARR